VRHPGDDEIGNAFRLVVLTAQRTRQLKDGARPRLAQGNHKLPWVALHEVRAGLLSWEIAPEAART
jgi:DNA-directed RNA polymerase omega subunit